MGCQKVGFQDREGDPLGMWMDWKFSQLKTLHRCFAKKHLGCLYPTGLWQQLVQGVA